MLKRTSIFLVGVLFALLCLWRAPIAHAAVPTPIVSITATAAKISGTLWSNDGSLGGNETLSAISTTPTYSASDTAVALNQTSGLGQYIRGFTGSTSAVTEMTIEANLNFSSTQSNASNGMIIGWWGSNYSVWVQNGTCMGFNTGSGEIYGFNPSSLLGAYHTYTYVMSTAQDNTSKQKIFVDGVQQTLTLCSGSLVSQSAKTWGNSNTFTIGIYGSNLSFPSTMKLRSLKLWNTDIGTSAIQESYNSQFPITSNVLAMANGTKTAIYRTSSLIRSTGDGDGIVTFYVDGKRIAGCINISTVSKVATCNWKPSKRGTLALTSVLKANGVTLNSNLLSVFISNRLTTR